MSEPTAEQPQVTATVSPPDPPRTRWGAIPHHLGRARTSTVVLSLLFLAVGALWLNIRPDPEVPPASSESVVDQPATDTVVPTTAPTTTPEVPTTEAEPTTAPTTSEVPTTTSEIPATTGTGTGTPLPTTSGTPAPLPDATATPTG